MNEIQIFNNPEFGQIRTLQIDGAPWFVGKDVAEALGYTDAFGALKKHVDAEDKQNCQNGSFATPRGMTVINQSGLYALIFGSKLNSAKKFKRWVTSEVLPALLHTGHYELPSKEKPDSIGATLNLDQTIKSLKKNFGKAYASQIIIGVCEHNGITASEKFLPDIKASKKSLPENFLSDDQYRKYTDQVQSMGVPHNKGTIVPATEFTDFCRRNKIPDRQFKQWLHENGYILTGKRTDGNIDYTIALWYDGGIKRYVVFT